LHTVEVAMPIVFDDLPTEIQLQIFETAAKSQWTPRVVEIYFKGGQIYSKTLPRPLLHVSRTSREVVLKLYKPWLPQFKGMAVNEPWERKLGNKAVDKMSRLQNVCVSLEHDTLLINDKQWSDWKFGAIERAFLRRLAVNLTGWFGWFGQRGLYTQFTHLKQLDVFHRGGDQEMLFLKRETIRKALSAGQKTNKNKRNKRRYIAPVLGREEVPTAAEWRGSVEQWITYKYPKGFKPTVPSRRPGRSWEEEDTGGVQSMTGEPQAARRRRGRPRREEVAGQNGAMPGGTKSSSQRSVPQQGTKRSRAEFDADGLPETKRPRGRPRKAAATRDVGGQQIPRRQSSQVSVEDIFAKIRSYLETFRTPTPETEASAPPSPETTFQSPLDKYEFLRELTKDGPEPLEISEELAPSPCPTFVDPRVVFQCEGSVEGPEIQETALPPSPFIDPRAVFQDLFDTSNDNAKARDSDNPQIPEEDDVLSLSAEKIGPASKEVVLGSLSGGYGFENVVERGGCFGVGSERDNDNHNHGTETVFEMPDLLAAALESSLLDVPSLDDEEYTPKQFMAERRTSEGLQFLVQWRDYPEEKDWTWETEAAMIESALDMVTAWLAKSDVEVDEENPITVDYIVERILGRRKFKGVAHYLVKWKGFEEVKDRTWEPCERLSIDVPLLVEAFEEKMRKK
jgi:hypothetical protein